MKGPGLNNCGLQKVAGVRPQKVQGRRLQPIGRWSDASPDLEFQGQAQDPGRQVGKDEAGPSDRGWGTRRAGAQPRSQAGAWSRQGEGRGRESPMLRTGAQNSGSGMLRTGAQGFLTPDQ